MGVVYKARQTRLNRIVALKMILAGNLAGEAELARFQTEAEAVARLQHPGIVQIHETGLHQGSPYFSLEFVGGGSLKDRLNGNPLPPKPAARMTMLLAHAVAAAHDKGILHRDLKPANVFLMPTKDKDGIPIEGRGRERAAGLAPAEVRFYPKIGDFGLAKHIDAEAPAGLTATGAVMGTPSYMPPEQARGDLKAIGPPTDTYALGAILYELLTGRPPFRAATAVQTIMQVVNEDPVPPSHLTTQTPRDLETICLQCLHKDPARRYASAGELAEDLDRFLKDEPIRARAVTRFERTWRWCRRNKAVAGLLGAVAAVLVVGIVISSIFGAVALWEAAQARRDKKAAQAAEKRAENAADELAKKNDDGNSSTGS